MTAGGGYMADKNVPKATDENKDKVPAAAGESIALTRADGSEALLYRYQRLEESDFTDDETIQVAFSSEYPGLQRSDKAYEKLGIAKDGETYLEILSHEDGEADFTQLNNRGAFLDEHVSMRQIGNVTVAALSKDKVGRAVLKFDGASKLSKTRKKQMRSGSRPHISNGYFHTRYLGKQELPDGRTAHRFAWAAREISSVADPMDPTVGARRSKRTEEYRCLGCAGFFTRDDLDEDYYCAECVAAVDPEVDEIVVLRAASVEKMKQRATAAKYPAVDEARKFRAKKKDGAEVEFSHNDLKDKVSLAADTDKRFKTKAANGNIYSDFWVRDVLQGPDGFSAIIMGPECLTYEVDFEFDGELVTLGEAQQVQYTLTWEVVETATERSAPKQKLRSAVDFPKVVTGRSSELALLTKYFMADKTAPELVVDNIDNPLVRKAIEERGYLTRATLEAEQKTRTQKFAARNKEIQDLTVEFVRDFGGRVGGKPKEKFYLRDRIQIAALEAQGMDDSKPDAEVRQIFRSRVDDLKRDSTAEPNLVEAANAPDDVAQACDLFAAIRRTVAEAKKRGHQSTNIMPYDGAEKEANDGIRLQLAEVPGGGRMLDSGGFILPRNAGARFARTNPRPGLKRDALAGDFATAGAFIKPEFMPYIELLRNRIVLAELGATFLGGLIGDVVFPRQEASTVAQSLAEGSQLNPFDQVLGQIKMTPHRVGSRQYYSRLAVLQATPDFEAFVWNDHSKVMALYIDEMGINGTGAADQPTGILNQPGINQLVFGGTPTYAQIVQFRTLIRKFNVAGSLGFATTSVGQGRLAVLPETLVGSTIVSGSTAAIWKGDEENGTVLGSRALASQQIPNDILLAGVFENLMIGSWGGIVSIVDNFTRADRDEIALTLNTYFDAAVRHAQAFTRSADSVNQ